MTTTHWLDEHGAKLRPKEGSRWMGFLNVMVLIVTLGQNKRFMDGYWTTTFKTIYYPTTVVDPYHPRYLPIIKHECIHVRQWRKWHVWFLLTYLLLPMPVLLAYGRWRWEREAYLVNLADAPDKERAINHYVDVLWREYAWTWPKGRMRKWFQAHVD